MTLDPEARKVGDRLRVTRTQRRMSLQDVEDASGGEFKASVLGAYERGHRAISVPRLQRLARFYSVPVDQFFNDPPEQTEVLRGTTIDLNRLESISGPEADMLNRYLSMIQAERRDYSPVLTVRREDLRVMTAMVVDVPA